MKLYTLKATGLLRLCRSNQLDGLRQSVGLRVGHDAALDYQR